MLRGARWTALLLVLAFAVGPAQHLAPRLFMQGIVLGADGVVRPITLDARAYDYVLGADSLGGLVVDPRYTDMAAQAVSDLRLLGMAGAPGAQVAAWDPAWRYVWPRDSAFVVAALCTGHEHRRAEVILRYLLRVHPSDGLWQARYLPDGSGLAPDARGVQLDGSGWVPWAVWYWWRTNTSGDEGVRRTVSELWPMVAASADAALRSLGPTGLPSVSPDYWELRETSVTLGTAAPLLLGLRSAASLAMGMGHSVDSARWDAAADRLASAIEVTFGPYGYPRRVPSGGMDAAVAFLAPPFAPRTAAVDAAVRNAVRRLRLPNGGLKPGERWRRDGIAWTPETALFALVLASSGDRAGAEELLSWLDAHRTAAGALPEQVSPDGRPIMVAPLGWTASLVLLTLSALNNGVTSGPVDIPS